MRISQMVKAKNRSLKTKLTLALASVASVAVLGSAGVAAASPAPKTMYLPNRQACSTQWSAFHFRNRGDCESYWNTHKHHGQGNGNHNPGDPGHGYGGNNSGGVTVVVNGDNNVINIVINYFFGG
jgi:hypothetical protein